MYDIIEAGIKLIPNEKTKAAINPETVFYEDFPLWVSKKGEFITSILALGLFVAFLRIAWFISFNNIG